MYYSREEIISRINTSCDSDALMLRQLLDEIDEIKFRIAALIERIS